MIYHVQKPSRMKCTGKLDPCFWRKKRIHREQAQHEAEETLENHWKIIEPTGYGMSIQQENTLREGLEVIRMTELNQPSNRVNLALRLRAGTLPPGKALCWNRNQRKRGKVM